MATRVHDAFENSLTDAGNWVSNGIGGHVPFSPGSTNVAIGRSGGATKDDLNEKMDRIAINEGGGTDISPYTEMAKKEAEEQACLGRMVDDEWINNRAKEIYGQAYEDTEPPEFNDGYGYRDWYSGKDVERMVFKLREGIEKEIQAGLDRRKSITKAEIKEQFEKEIEKKYSDIYHKRTIEFFQSMIPMAVAIVAAIVMNVLPYPWNLVTVPMYAYLFFAGFKTMRKMRRVMAELGEKTHTPADLCEEVLLDRQNEIKKQRNQQIIRDS